MNLKMVNRMENIHFGKEDSKYPGGPPTLSRVKQRSGSQHLGSLNYFNRKKDSQTITDENNRLYNRLKESSAVIKKVDHEAHFNKHLKYQNIKSRANMIQFVTSA